MQSTSAGGSSIPKLSPTEKRTKIDEIKNRLKPGGDCEAVSNPKKTSSFVWNDGNFLVIRKKGTEAYEDFAICCKCGDLKSYVLGKQTSNLSRHLSKCEGTEAGASLKSTVDFVTVTPEMKSDFKDVTLDFCVEDARPFNIAAGKGFLKFVQKVIDMTALYGRMNVSDLISDPTTLSRALKERTELARQEVAPEITKKIREGNCAGTTDLWTESYTQNHYMTVTLHFLDDEWELKNLTLFTCKFPYESATGENIKEEIISQFSEFSLTREDYFRIEWVTDGGANVIKALENNNRSNCMAHGLNVVLKNLLSFKLKDLDLFGTDGSSLVDNAEELVSYVKSNRIDHQLPSVLKAFPKKPNVVSEQVLVRQYKSKVPALESLYNQYEDLRHIMDSEDSVVGVSRLNSINKDDLKDLIEVVKSVEDAASSGVGTGDTLKSVLKENEGDSTFRTRLCKHLKSETAILEALESIESCKELVAYMKRSGLNNLLHETLKQEIETRWNTLLRMLQSIYNSFEQIIEILEKKGQISRFNGINKNKLLELIRFLEPFKKQTSQIEGDTEPTLPHVLLCYAVLDKHCQPRASDSAVIKKLRSRGRFLLENKIKSNFKDSHRLATFLHPQYKQLNFLSDGKRDQVYSLARQFCADAETKAVLAEKEVDDNGDDRTLSDSEPPEKRRRTSEDDDDDYAELRDRAPSPSVLKNEVSQYLDNTSCFPKGKIDILAFWKSKAQEWPHLSKLARRILCIPASSAPSERVFSLAGLTISARRTCLSPQNVNAILFLNSYLKFSATRQK